MGKQKAFSIQVWYREVDHLFHNGTLTYEHYNTDFAYGRLSALTGKIQAKQFSAWGGWLTINYSALEQTQNAMTILIENEI